MNKSKIVANLQAKNLALETRISELELDISNEKDKNISLETSFNQSRETLEQQNKIQQVQLDKNETKKLAKAYEDQETDYKKDVRFWGGAVACIFIGLTIKTFLSPSGNELYEIIRHYSVDLILVAALWFSSAQYSNYVGLRNDYANRKTLAQSFNNILNNLQEDGEIKQKFIEKTTDILCAPVAVSKKDQILSKEVLKQVIEVTKLIKG